MHEHILPTPQENRVAVEDSLVPSEEILSLFEPTGGQSCKDSEALPTITRRQLLQWGLGAAMLFAGGRKGRAQEAATPTIETPEISASRSVLEQVARETGWNTTEIIPGGMPIIHIRQAHASKKQEGQQTDFSVPYRSQAKILHFFQQYCRQRSSTDLPLTIFFEGLTLNQLEKIQNFRSKVNADMNALVPNRDVWKQAALGYETYAASLPPTHTVYKRFYQYRLMQKITQLEQSLSKMPIFDDGEKIKQDLLKSFEQSSDPPPLHWGAPLLLYLDGAVDLGVAEGTEQYEKAIKALNELCLHYSGGKSAAEITGREKAVIMFMAEKENHPLWQAIENERENATLKLIMEHPASHSEAGVFLVYGRNHRFRDNIAARNSENSKKKLGLIELALPEDRR